MEPIFIGTNSDPPYDERLSWDGRGEKMTQAYEMCLMDYEFHVLSSAYLVHQPGISKGSPPSPTALELKRRQRDFRNVVVIPEIENRLGTKIGCVVGA